MFLTLKTQRQWRKIFSVILLCSFCAISIIQNLFVFLALIEEFPVISSWSDKLAASHAHFLCFWCLWQDTLLRVWGIRSEEEASYISCNATSLITSIVYHTLVDLISMARHSEENIIIFENENKSKSQVSMGVLYRIVLYISIAYNLDYWRLLAGNYLLFHFIPIECIALY